MEPGAIVSLIVVGLILNVMLTLFVLVATDGGIINLLPADLHRVTDMNWVGCTIVSLLAFVVFPILYIGKLIYFLFHI